MKRITISLAMLLVFASFANATNTTNYVTDGQFESPNGDVGPWANMFGGDTISFLSSGGNPNGCLQIADSGSYGGVAYVNPPALTLASLGLTAGNTYTFVMDMQIVSGANIGGLKIESWNDTAIINNSGNIYPLSGSTSWATYTFSYTIAASATHLNIVPLWGPNSTVNYDNIGVIVVGTTPVSVSITSPTNNQVVNSNFTISATAAVSPGTVTNVSFYVDNSLVGAATNSPYGYIATGIAAGAHSLKAVATDSSGNHATSSVVAITVTNAAAPAFSAYESFNYTSLGAGTPTTGTGFTGNWSCGAAGTLVSGLTYPNLATANNALQSSSSYQLESLANPPSGLGTVWVSFLFQQAGDNGGNRDGFVLEDMTGKGVMFAYQQFQAAVGEPALAAVSSYTTVGSQLTPHSGATQTYNNANFYVLKLTYTGGSLASVVVYSNPTAGQGTAPTADFTVSSGLSGIGVLNTIGIVHQGGMAITVDEVRAGATFADVVGANLNPTVPTTVVLSTAAVKKVSWTAQSTNYYQPQSSTDGVNWNNLGPVLYGSSVSSVYDFAPVAFYQVLQILPVTQEETINGGFEMSDGFGGAAYWQGGGSQPPIQITSDFHTGAASVMFSVTNTATTAQTSVLQQDVGNVGGPAITGGSSYTFSFWAKALAKNPSGGYIQQYNLEWLNSAGGIVGATGFNNFTAGSGAWAQVNAGSLVAPTNAVDALVEFFSATGGINNDFGGVLLDDVSLSGTTPSGSTSVLPATVQNGADFTAMIETNGILATAASGTITFKTNSVLESSQTVAGGSTSSTPTVTPTSYSVTAIYSGDATYIGSTSTLVIGGGVNPVPTNIVVTVAGNQLTLSWPADHTGWTLQAQTNTLAHGLGGTWYDVAGSTATNQVVTIINPANPTVFYRLKY